MIHNWQIIQTNDGDIKVLKLSAGYLLDYKDRLIYIEHDIVLESMILVSEEPEVPVEPELPPGLPEDPELPPEEPPVEPELPPVDPPVEPPVEPEVPPEPVVEYLDVINNGQANPFWTQLHFNGPNTITQQADHIEVTLTNFGGFNFHRSNQTLNCEDYEALEIEFEKTAGAGNLFLNLINGQVDRQSQQITPRPTKELVVIPITALGLFTNVTIKVNYQGPATFKVYNLKLRKKAQVELPPAEPEVPPGTPVLPDGWLKTSGNKILNSDDSVWMGRGANIFDTRSCSSCVGAPIADSVAEVKRRIDFLVTSSKANFVRLCLDTTFGDGNIIQSPTYLAGVKDIVAHCKTIPGLKVLLSNWVCDSFGPEGVPTEQTNAILRKMVREFANDSHVMFGVCNEPENNFNGAQDAQRKQLFENAVAAIRSEETAVGCPTHLVAVQGLGGWARRIAYYVNNPISVLGGQNVIYEIHVYDGEAQFNSMLLTPAQTLPVIVGEFGPAPGYMTMQDCASLMTACEAAKIPFLGWAYHMRCPPNMLVDNSGGSCGIGMNLQHSDWGTLLATQIAAAAG